MGSKKSYSSRRVRDRSAHLPAPKPSDHSVSNSNSAPSTNPPVNSTTEPRPRVVSNSIGFSRDGWVLEGRQPGCILNRKLSNDTLSHILVEDNLIVLGIPINSERSTVSKAKRWKTNGANTGANYQPASYQPASPFPTAPSYQPAPSYQLLARGMGSQDVRFAPAMGDVRFDDVMENLRLGAVRSQASRGVSGAWSAPASAVGSFAAGINDGEKGKEKVKEVENVKEDQGEPANGAEETAAAKDQTTKLRNGDQKAVESEDEAANRDLKDAATKVEDLAQATVVKGEEASEINGGGSFPQSLVDEGVQSIGHQLVSDDPNEAVQHSVYVEDQTVKSEEKVISGVEEQAKDIKAVSEEFVESDTKQRKPENEDVVAMEDSTAATAEESKLINSTTKPTGEAEPGAKNPLTASAEPAAEVPIKVEKKIKDYPEGVVDPVPSSEPQEEKVIKDNKEDDIIAAPTEPKDSEQPNSDSKETDNITSPAGLPEDIKASREGSGDLTTSESSNDKKDFLASKEDASDPATEIHNDAEKDIKDPAEANSHSVSDAANDIKDEVKDSKEESGEPTADAYNDTEKDVVAPKEDSGEPITEEPHDPEEGVKDSEEINDNLPSLSDAEKKSKGSDYDIQYPTLKASKDVKKEVKGFTGDNGGTIVEASNNTKEDAKGSSDDNDDAKFEASNKTMEDPKESQERTTEATPPTLTVPMNDTDASTDSTNKPPPDSSKPIEVTNPQPTPAEKDTTSTTAAAAAAEKAKYPLTPIPLNLFKKKPSSLKK